MCHNDGDVQGEGGVLNLEKEFVETAERLCKEKDMLLIVDEVQTGMRKKRKTVCL